MEKQKPLKIVMIPWLAMGHLIPFLELSKYLAKKGLQIYLITTPKNIQRLPKTPSSITLISIPLPHLDGVPDEAESSMDVPSLLQPLLKSRFDSLELPISDLLHDIKPNWIIYDFTSYWVPSLAANVGASCAYLSLFNAATMSFIGPPNALLGNARSSPEDFISAPSWIPFESNIAYYSHEVNKLIHSIDGQIATPDPVRFGYSIERSDLVAIRSSYELEPKWVELLSEIYAKMVLPIGFLFPDSNHYGDQKWVVLKKWLDKQRLDSVIYVAFGSESSMSIEELKELALGLELSGLPFLLVLRDLPGSTQNVLGMLPKGFEDRVANRGMIHLGWAPQFDILNHPSVGGFLTHCGWNSIVEGLGLGRVLVLLPLMNDQGLVSRFLVGEGLGIEVAREEPNGSLSRETVDKAVRVAMVEDEGATLRGNAKKMRGVIGNNNLNECYMDRFIQYLEDNS